MNNVWVTSKTVSISKELPCVQLEPKPQEDSSVLVLAFGHIPPTVRQAYGRDWL